MYAIAYSFSSKLHWSTTYRSNNSYCLSVFLNIWVFINMTSLACFQTILGDMLREKKNLTPSILKIAPQKHLLYIMLIIAVDIIVMLKYLWSE